MTTRLMYLLMSEFAALLPTYECWHTKGQRSNPGGGTESGAPTNINPIPLAPNPGYVPQVLPRVDLPTRPVARQVAEPVAPARERFGRIAGHAQPCNGKFISFRPIVRTWTRDYARHAAYGEVIDAYRERGAGGLCADHDRRRRPRLDAK